MPSMELMRGGEKSICLNARGRLQQRKKLRFIDTTPALGAYRLFRLFQKEHALRSRVSVTNGLVDLKGAALPAKRWPEESLAFRHLL